MKKQIASRKLFVYSQQEIAPRTDRNCQCDVTRLHWSVLVVKNKEMKNRSPSPHSQVERAREGILLREHLDGSSCPSFDTVVASWGFRWRHSLLKFKFRFMNLHRLPDMANYVFANRRRDVTPKMRMRCTIAGCRNPVIEGHRNNFVYHNSFWAYSTGTIYGESTRVTRWVKRSASINFPF